MGDIHMETAIIKRKQLSPGMWIMPQYDRESGLTKDGEMPIPEKVMTVIHRSSDGVTGVRTQDKHGLRQDYTFTDADEIEIVL
jgi:hypothetical protein